MTTWEMQCILMLSESLNFNKTAQELNITQPAFSRTIQRAEQELGFKLFLRNTRSVQMTREGAAFMAYLRRAFVTYKGGIEEVQNMMRHQNGLCVACAAKFISMNFAPLAVEFRKQNPGLWMECVPLDMSQIPNSLRSRQSDIAFLCAERERFASDFEVKVIRHIPLHVMLNEDNPLSQKPYLDAKDLENQRIVTIRTNASSNEIESYESPLLILNRKYGLHLRETTVVESFPACLLCVAFGQGIALVSSDLEYLTPPNCVMRPIDGVESSFLALWNRGGLSATAQQFMEFVCVKMGAFSSD